MGCAKLDDELSRRGYRLYVINEVSGAVVASERLVSAAGETEVYWWATMRSADDAAHHRGSRLQSGRTYPPVADASAAVLYVVIARCVAASSMI